MANLEMLLGEITQRPPQARGIGHGANHSGWNLRTAEGVRTPDGAVRPLKKKSGGCKTCDGTGCVGRCRF